MEAERGGEPTTEEISFFTGRRIVQTLVIVLALLAAVYLLFPSLVGLEDAIAKLDDAQPAWLLVALGFGVMMFATYVALFRGVVGGDVLPLTWREAYEINMASLAATRLFSAGGAGGIVLTYWALRKAGMDTRRSTQRMVMFLALQYTFYPLAIIVFGVLLRTGVLEGKSNVELTIIPAAIAGVVIFVGVLVALIPHDLERRIARWAEGYGRAGLAQRLAKGPAAVADGLRKTFDLFGHPSRGGLAVLGAAGFWASQVAILWASFRAFGISVPVAVLVQGFFLGMVANLIPFVPAGVGAVDAGLIGAFVLFGLPEATVFAAVLIYRLVAFWLPLPPGIAAFFQLRGTVGRWEREGRPIDRYAAPAVAGGV
ncbi:MAG: lysylphosphatidylglycerol synthase transmembrane domain-containing protein [Actinomycetota bacterium]